MKELDGLDKILRDFSSLQIDITEAKDGIIQWALSKLPKKKDESEQDSLHKYFGDIRQDKGFNQAITQAEENIKGDKNE